MERNHYDDLFYLWYFLCKYKINKDFKIALLVQKLEHLKVLGGLLPIELPCLVWAKTNNIAPLDLLIWANSLQYKKETYKKKNLKKSIKKWTNDKFALLAYLKLNQIIFFSLKKNHLPNWLGSKFGYYSMESDMTGRLITRKSYGWLTLRVERRKGGG